MKRNLLRTAVLTAFIIMLLPACTIYHADTASAECAKQANGKNTYSKAHDNNGYALCLDAAKERQKEKQQQDTALGIVDFIIDLLSD